MNVRQVDPAEFSPGEFAHLVRADVEQRDVRLIIIDSLNGYMAGMPDEQHLAMHMHELLSYLSNRNVCTLVTLNQQGMTSMQALEDAEVRRNAAQSELAAARARLVTARQQVGRTEIRAPFDGRVSEDFKLTTGTWVSVGTLRNWEQKRVRPDGPARVLLTVIDRDPVSVLKALRIGPNGATSKRRRAA